MAESTPNNSTGNAYKEDLEEIKGALEKIWQLQRYTQKRRGHKRAIIAIARMMLTCLFHMFSKQEVFNPADTDYSAIPEEMYQKFQEQYDKNAIKRLGKRGFTIIPPVATA